MTLNISLYIPSFNSSRYLWTTLKAIDRQTLSPSEVIVVDDGSTDGTAEIARANEVLCVRHERNKGLAAARNTGVRESSSDFVAALDSDCAPSPRWLETLAESMGNDLVGVGGRLIEQNQASIVDRWRAVHMKQNWGESVLVNPPFLFGSNTLFRKTALEEVGGYNEKLRTNYEDVDISHKLLSRGSKLLYQPAATAYHRKSDSALTCAVTYWRWENPSPEVKYPGGSGIPKGFGWDTRMAGRLVISDLLSGRSCALLTPMFWFVWVAMSIMTAVS